MTDLAFPLLPHAIAIAGATQLFPVGRVFCVGRNYADHAREMGADARTPPLFFMKPATAVTTAQTVPYPDDTDELHHEVEMVIALGPGGLPFGRAVGVDLTKRDVQSALKKAGAPWEPAKAFDASAPLGPITPLTLDDLNADGAIRLSVNGAVRQNARLSDMSWRPSDILEHLAKVWTLRPGDLIFTGTPAGVGPLARGDRVRAEVEGLAPLEFAIA